MEESTNSSEEMVDQSNIDLGVGRSYECVFCKRGFNTAQALGGHMNIHRKDRARNKPANSTKQFMQQTPSSLLHQIMPSSNIPRDHTLSYPATNYFPDFAGAHDDSSSNSTLYESNYYYDRDDDHRSRQQPVSISGDWRLRLSLEVEDMDKNRLNQVQEKELDLELRLGL